MTNRHRLVPCVPFLAIMFATLFLAFPALAQQQQSLPAAEQTNGAQLPATQQSPSGESRKDEKNKSQPKNNGTSHDRLFYTLPNFLTLENASQVPPLTTGQKFKVVARSSFDYVQYPWYGFLSGISQGENSEPGYGQGAAGYGKRFGAATADGTIENFTTSAVFPSLFRQDPRFFQSGKGGFWHRTWYSFSRIMITRSDAGKAQVNFSEILGSAVAAGVSTYSYHPHDDKTLRNTAKVWGTQVGYDALTYVVKEFWPDIRRKIRKQERR